MREIKFRAWDEVDGYLGKVTLIDFDEESVYIETRYADDQNQFNLGEIPLMQYTGLKDKNGKEIFEGDIVQTLFSKQEGFVYECFYHEESGSYLFDPFMFGNKDAPLLGIEEFAQCWDEVEICEIIGNIYENPELLGDSK